MNKGPSWFEESHHKRETKKNKPKIALEETEIIKGEKKKQNLFLKKSFIPIEEDSTFIKQEKKEKRHEKGKLKKQREFLEMKKWWQKQKFSAKHRIKLRTFPRKSIKKEEIENEKKNKATQMDLSRGSNIWITRVSEKENKREEINKEKYKS